ERKLMEEELRESEERFRLIFENAFDGMSIFEEAEDPVDRRLVECNRRYAELAGRPREELLRLGSMQGLALELSDKNERAITEGNVFRGSFSWIRPDRAENFIEFTAVPIEMRGKKFTIGIDRDVTDRVAAQTEREKLIHQLQAALADVKTLSGLVPICANCKKIRDDKGYWTQIEAYIQAHTPATFSHGICPDCGRKLYPEVYGTDVSETHPL
ncbi:MAG TPA: PAS domain S-box protein, partial [Bacteroidota bacterium]|nr:PAS domain S-box protein [Bacteroidota bacterium]